MIPTLLPSAHAQIQQDRNWTPHFQVACKADLYTPEGVKKKLVGVSKLFLPQDEMGANTAAKIQMGPFTLVGMIEMKGKSESRMTPSFIMNIFNNNPVTTSIFNMGLNGIYFQGIEKEALEVEGMQFRELTHEGQLYTRIDYACKIRARLTRKQFLMREIARKRAYIRYLSWKRDQAELRKKMEGPKERSL
ncbi:MAG: hypothetical protein JST80_01605 [Bdellovibrionales bacterium]|nr:hypothetical protein [Bdellovibrionales bacterium]